MPWHADAWDGQREEVIEMTRHGQEVLEVFVTERADHLVTERADRTDGIAVSAMAVDACPRPKLTTTVRAFEVQ